MCNSQLKNLRELNFIADVIVIMMMVTKSKGI